MRLCEKYKLDAEQLQASLVACRADLTATESALSLIGEQRREVEHLHEVMRLVTQNALEEDDEEEDSLLVASTAFVFPK